MTEMPVDKCPHCHGDPVRFFQVVSIGQIKCKSCQQNVIPSFGCIVRSWQNGVFRIAAFLVIWPAIILFAAAAPFLIPGWSDSELSYAGGLALFAFGGFWLALMAALPIGLVATFWGRRVALRLDAQDNCKAP